MRRNINDLMQVPAQQRDLSWLADSLQAAIRLEFATVPVYLCGMWSIKTQSGPAFSSIRSVVIDEMFHMGLACNMLTTIGGTPELTNVPTYPGALPGGVRPWLRIALIGLNKATVDEMYMQIEYPESGPIAHFKGETFPTIGKFYDAILDAFRKLQESEITGVRQITQGPKLFAIATLADAERAIDRIKRQGEGTSQSPFSDDFGTNLAHYYKFAEIFRERKLIQLPSGEWKYEGAPIPFPDAFPMAEVPEGGYPDVPKALEFNQAFTTMVGQLQQAWVTGDGNELGAAIGAMFQLRGPARELMQMPLPAGGGNYGPDFRLIP